jgi:hypothetical protein
MAASMVRAARPSVTENTKHVIEKVTISVVIRSRLCFINVQTVATKDITTSYALSKESE